MPRIQAGMNISVSWESAVRWVMRHVGVNREEAKEIVRNAKAHGFHMVTHGNHQVSLSF